MAANGFESDGRNNLLDFFLGSLARAASSLFALIILITVVSSGYSLMTSEREKSLRDEMTAREAKNVQLLVKLTGLVKKIQIDVIQVQQFLSDYSATRGLDGHDDGLPSAENFAQQFTADAAAAKDAAREFNAPALIDVLTNMEGQFPAYYSQGVVMAKVYAAEGPGEGNKLMGAFDTVSDEMQEQLTRSDAALEESKAQWEKANALADEQLEMLRSNARFATLVSFMASVLACVLGIISVRIWIVAPIVRVADNFMRLARGSMDYDVIKSGRRDEIGDLIRTFNTFRTIVTEAEAGRIRARQQDELLASHQQLAETER